jgi:hypothetical protein
MGRIELIVRGSSVTASIEVASSVSFLCFDMY